MVVNLAIILQLALETDSGLTVIVNDVTELAELCPRKSHRFAMIRHSAPYLCSKIKNSPFRKGGFRGISKGFSYHQQTDEGDSYY